MKSAKWFETCGHTIINKGGTILFAITLSRPNIQWVVEDHYPGLKQTTQVHVGL
jgi:hypothetical protein